MPAAGTSKCRYCAKFASTEKTCRLSGYCEACCRARCPYMCGRVRCRICGTPEPAMNAEGPRQEVCGYCSKHVSCCSFTCQECNGLYCTDGYSKRTCGGKTRCTSCHSRVAPSCLHCGTCGEKVETVTECCRKCTECCQDAGCRQIVKYEGVPMAMMKQVFCGHCEIRQYGDCCDRCGMKTSTHAKQMVPVAHLADSFIKNKSKRLAGVEIEVSKYKGGKKASAIAKSESCAVMSDGSVPEGFELCTNPANGDRFVKKIEDICSVLKEAKCIADDKSGLHVHIDCHDFSWHELRRLIMIYARIEPALYMIIDKRRALSRYSKMYGAGLAEMVSDPSTAKRDIMSLVFGDQRNSSFAQGFSKGSHGSDRYYGLNLSSWWIRGTVEFRMHHGTTQAYKIVHWSKLLLSLADTAARCTDSEANNWPAGTAGLLKLCPDENTSWYVALRYQYFQLMRLEKEEAKRTKKRIQPRSD